MSGKRKDAKVDDVTLPISTSINNDVFADNQGNSKQSIDRGHSKKTGKHSSNPFDSSSNNLKSKGRDAELSGYGLNLEHNAEIKEINDL